MRFSLTWKLVFLIVLLALAFVILTTYQQVEQSKDTIINAYMDEADSLTRSIVETKSKFSETTMVESVRTLLGSYEQNFDNIDRIQIVGLGVCISDTTCESYNFSSNFYMDHMHEGIEVAAEVVTLDGEDKLRVVQDIELDSSQNGFLIIDYSLQSVYEKINNKIFEIVLLRIIILLIFTIISIIFIRTLLVKNLDDLMEAINRIKSGKYAVKLNIKTNDEFQEIAESLKSMSKHINKDHKEIAKKVEELELANSKITHLLKLKSEFIVQVAHDLNTPLTPINTSIPVIDSKISSCKDKKLTKSWELVKRNLGYVMNIVKDTLSISELDTDNRGPYFSKMDIKKLILNLLKRHKYERIAFKDISKTKLKINYSIRGDMVLLETVFTQILDNSLKFTNLNKKDIQVCLQRNKTHFIISIIDKGVGLSKDKLKKIFHDFYKADESRHERSSGLGLSIAKRIVERHDGQIWAESKGIGKGTTIRIKLPTYESELESNSKNKN